MAVSVLRRYTPPTCTLEIMAKKSPLSRWTDQQVLKDVRFRLAIDGPHLSSDRHLRVQGDRTQLDTLCDVVDAYVQQMLNQSASHFSQSLFQPLPDVSGKHPSESSSSHRAAAPIPMQPGRSVVPPDVLLNRTESSATLPDISAIQQSNGLGVVVPSGFALLPKGKLKHQLWLGTLAPPQRPFIVLSTLELFDLANALEQYRADALILPDLQQSGWLKSTPAWMKIAAVMVFAVGVTTSVAQVLQQSAPVSTTSEEAPIAESEEASEADDLGAIAPQTREEAGLPDSLGDDPVSVRRAQRRQRRAATEGTPEAQQAPSNPTESRAGIPGESAGSGTPGSSATPPPQPQGIPPELAAIPPVSQQESMRSADRAAEGADEGSPAAPPSAMRQAPAADAAPEESFATSAPSAPPSTIPQVNEVRAYFQQQWQPPEDLDRSVEYHLLIGPDGTLQRVTPLGQTARAYASQTGMPPLGQRFVSRLENNRSAQIRLILQPSGQVRAFLESWN